MSEHDDLERMLLKVSERRIEALERELDRKLSRLWRVHADLSPDLTPRPPSLIGKGDQAPPGPFVLPPSAARFQSRQSLVGEELGEGSSRSRWRSLALRRSS
jgi:hypothetical protein